MQLHTITAKAEDKALIERIIDEQGVGIETLNTLIRGEDLYLTVRAENSAIMNEAIADVRALGLPIHDIGYHNVNFVAVVPRIMSKPVVEAASGENVVVIEGDSLFVIGAVYERDITNVLNRAQVVVSVRNFTGY